MTRKHKNKSWMMVRALSALAFCLGGCIGGGDDEPTTRIVTATVTSGLDNPTAVAIGAGGVLVAESGAARIVTVAEDGTVTPLIAGFEAGTFSPYTIGPLGLVEAGDGGLIVGEGGRPSGQDVVSFFSADGTPSFDSLVPTGGGDYYGLAVRPSTGDLLIASASTDRIFGAPPDPAGGFSEARLIIDDTTDSPIGGAAPTALAFDPDGLLYVGFAGEGSAKIVRIDTETSFVEPVASTETAVTGIAFRPSDAVLFYSVLGDPEAASGAVFNIGTNGVAEAFVQRLAGPTALAFGSDDALYVTTLGSPANGAAGQLLKITVEEIVSDEAAVVAEEGP